MTHTVVVNVIPTTDPRLGRHVRHDSRSRAFAYTADQAAYRSVRHRSAIPVLDQGNYGSCTGNASTKNLSYVDDSTIDFDASFWEGFDAKYPGILSKTSSTANEKVAVGVYSDAEVVDGNPPFNPNDPSTDNGSTGLSVARVLKSRGWISGYQHAFSLDAALTALSRQAVIVGTNWYTGMFDPSAAGELVISGKVEGGHEYVLDEIDVTNQRVWMQNSWGEGWGQSGRAWMSWDTLTRLLGEQGDCTIFAPLTAPAPTPTPPPPAADPTATWVAQAEYWISLRHSSVANTTFEKQTQAYLDWLKTQS